MNKYGRAAVKATKIIRVEPNTTPRKAWDLATSEIFGPGTSSQKKGCPKDAFLGLCQEGFIRGIRPGIYTKSTKNKAYATRAVQLLKDNPHLATDGIRLRRLVMKGHNKTHNGQMDVVIGLWQEGWISGE